MSATEEVLGQGPPRARSRKAMPLAGVFRSARFYVYLCCSALALVTSIHLGKEMLWDTLNYHLYAGFSAVHDRFGADYFPAAWQAYLNPYAYVPFYALVTSGLSALQAALVLGMVQSGILWLTYEIALAVCPGGRPGSRQATGILAVALAFANPVLINQIGSSFADITTAELVLAGWLLLLAAMRAPGTVKIVCAAALLGAATALKLTNAIAAIAATPMLLFIPGAWRIKLRQSMLYALSLGVAFAMVSAPWSLHLQRQFGNPFFPLLNGLFRSPYFATAPLADLRFVPTSVGAALLLPFTMTLPRGMVHVEWAAPDLRYALLLIMGILLLAIRAPKFRLRARDRAPGVEAGVSGRSAAALGCGFVTAWILWLTASGNSRYFISMACVAAVLGVVLVLRVFARYPRVRNYVLLATFGVQFFQLHAGTQYHTALPWRGAWFNVSVPQAIESQPALYFSIGPQSNSFVVPYLAPGSGFINLEGIYTLGADGPNGRRIAGLIRRYSPSLRVILRDTRSDPVHQYGIPYSAGVNDALEPFGLRVVANDCSKIVVRGITPPAIVMAPAPAPAAAPATPSSVYSGVLVTCRVVRGDGQGGPPPSAERAANLALDHLEQACPALFQPRGMTTYFLGGKDGYVYVRRYPNTDVAAWVDRKWVRFQRIIGGGKEQYAGPEAIWERRPLPVQCGRRSEGDYLRVLQPARLR